MLYSPINKKAVKEIKEILEHYELSGAIVLHDMTYGGHGEYHFHADKKNTCIEVKEHELLASTKHIESKAEKKRLIDATINTLNNMRNGMATMFHTVDHLYKKIEKQFEITEVSKSHISGNLGDN